MALAQRFEYKQGIALCLVGIGGVASAVRQAERAARLLSAAETLLDSIGLSLDASPELRADYDRYGAAARNQLDAATFAAAWAEERAMSLDDRYGAAARNQLDAATFAAAWAEGRAMSLDQAVAEALNVAA